MITSNVTPSLPLRVAFFTLGCKVNQCDTASMMARFAAAGHNIVDFNDMADCYIVNSCTVTGESDRKSRQVVARAHKKNPEAIICLTGCLAQRDAEAALALPGVRLALGNRDRGRIVALVEGLLHNGQDACYSAVQPWTSAEDFEDLPAQREGKTRATLKIQEGCNRYCTYCIIPYARGPLRSRSLESILREGRQLAEAGYLELVLTGIHLASYRGENGESLMDVVEALANIDGLARIRLGSLEPSLLTADFARRAADCSKLCPQFHVSMQSGSSSVLQRMGRRYSAEAYLTHLDILRAALPKAAVTTDVIVGFPGESDEEFQNSLATVERCAFARLHVFPFSPREGVPAASMPDQLPKAVKQVRAREMIALGEAMQHRYQQSFLGQSMDVLFESWSPGGMAEGYTGNYLRVQTPSPVDLGGQIRPVTLLDIQEDLISGTLFNYGEE